MLIGISIIRDVNEHGDPAFLVNCKYWRGGNVITVPDDKGWPTYAEALSDRERIILESFQERTAPGE